MPPNLQDATYADLACTRCGSHVHVIGALGRRVSLRCVLCRTLHVAPERR